MKNSAPHNPLVAVWPHETMVEAIERHRRETGAGGPYFLFRMAGTRRPVPAAASAPAVAVAP